MNKTGYVENKKDKGRFYPKGEEVKYITREGEEASYPNARGSHLVRIPGKGLQYLSRKEARRKSKSNPATKKNYGYQNDKLGFVHTVGKTEVRPRRPSGISNHIAHRERQIIREMQRTGKSRDDVLQSQK